MEAYERYEHAGVIVEIVQDNDSGYGPQENDNAGTIYSWTRAWDGDERITEPELQIWDDDTEESREVDLPEFMRHEYDAVLTLPLFFADYGSSGARIYVDDHPNCAICFTQEDLDKEWHGSVDDATKYAQARINELDEWFQGYVYGIVIRERRPEFVPESDGQGDVLDSVWGFIGDLYGESGKYIYEEANSLAEEAAKQVAHERELVLDAAYRDVVTV